MIKHTQRELLSALLLSMTLLAPAGVTPAGAQEGASTATPLRVTRIAPTAGAPGTAVTVSGSNLAGASVTLGGVAAQVTGSSANSLTFVVPQAATGLIRLTKPDAALTFPGQFTVFVTSAGTTYYVSPQGSNNNTGRTTGSAWQTLARVAAATLQPGDRVLLQGGQTFSGPLSLSEVQGTAASPIYIGSYGTGRATINGGTGSGLVLTNANHVVVERLRATGAGRKSGNDQGDGFNLESSSNVILHDLEASGFQRTGIRIRQGSNVRVVSCFAHTNGFAGIFAEFGNTCNQNLYVGYSRAHDNDGDPTITDNHSGNGILLFDTNTALIEFCESQKNGSDQPLGPPNGPVGIWTSVVDKVTIQYCISHDNETTSGDGGGFDFDGGTTNSLLQYNLSYGNQNVGYLFWEWGAGGISGNTARYNISVNDRDGGFRFGKSGPGDIFNNLCYNNLVINNSYPAVKQDTVENVYNNVFRNNVFITPNSPSLSVSSGARFENNVYWRGGNGFSVDGYNSLESWANASGQEKINGQIVGLFVDPKLVNASATPTLTDPFLLSSLSDYTLQATSPLIDKGLNLNALYGIDPGPRDFFGNALPYGPAFDIGVHESSTPRSGTSDNTTYYRIRCRWEPYNGAEYLYDAGELAGYSWQSDLNNTLYHWSLETTDSSHTRFRNRQTGDVLHIENLVEGPDDGNLRCTPGQDAWYSSRWNRESVGEGTYERFNNAWQNGTRIHIQNTRGNAEYGSVEPGWWSGQWTLEPVPSGSSDPSPSNLTAQ